MGNETVEIEDGKMAPASGRGDVMAEESRGVGRYDPPVVDRWITFR